MLDLIQALTGTFVEPELLKTIYKDEINKFSFVTFTSSNISGLFCSGNHLFTFLVVQGICISNESIFVYKPSSLFNFCNYSSNQEYKGMDNLNLGL